MHNFYVFLIKVPLVILLIGMCCLFNPLWCQIKWDGEGADGLWNTATNWVGNIVPSSTDNVLLDHSSITGNYTIVLPAGANGVVVQTLIIFPAASKTIEVHLPITNTAIPGFTATGPGYGLTIYQGGIFKNSSGASNGTPVNISDSIKIINGGSFIHNTSRAHAANVMVLSRVPGTEQGMFEFDVPGGAGYTVSIAARVYGTMVLSANAAGGTKSYTSTGTTSVNINGHFIMNPGVNYSLNYSGTFIINGDFIQQGNLFDISSGLHSNRIISRSNMIQSGIITESGTGLPVLEFEGISNQNISIPGIITGNTTVRINNPNGITLQSPVSISYRLEFVNGSIRTTTLNVLVLDDNATCSSGSPNSFVEGPMRKIGDDNFIFPLGKQGDYAPLSISGTGTVSDEFVAEYYLGNPTIIFGSTVESPPIIRISRLEYWILQQTIGASSKKVTLQVRTYSNATLLEKLVIGHWNMQGNIWKSEGNTAFAGVASGTVTSADVSSFGVFTLASTVVDQNPLPLQSISFSVRNQNSNALLSWKINPALEPLSFEILRSTDKTHFEVITKMNASGNQLTYQFSDKLSEAGVYYYKLKITEKNGSVTFSTTGSLFYQQKGIELISVSPVITRGTTNLTLSSSKKGQVHLYLLNTEGKAVRKISTIVENGSTSLMVDVSTIPAGIFYITGMANGMKTNSIRLIKL